MFTVAAYAQTEDDFLPEVRLLVMDSTELAVQNFCKEIITVVPEYKFAFVDRENVMLSKYMYDNPAFETIRLEFQFGVEEAIMPDSTIKKRRLVRLMRITAELSVMTKIYNYIFNESHTPDKLMAISNYDKPISYKDGTYNSSIVSDDYKAGYWTLSFFSR